MTTNSGVFNVANKRDISFATFNLLNLQEPGKFTYSRQKPAFEDTLEGQAIYEQKLAWIGQKLQLLDADVIGFQEVWSAASLEQAFAKGELTSEYDIIARDAPGLGRPQVAIAVRKGMVAKTQQNQNCWQEHFPDTFVFDSLKEMDGAEEEITVTINKFSRPVLCVDVQIEARSPTPPPIRVYVAHLKSKGPARLRGSRDNQVLENHSAITLSAVSHIRRVMEAGALRAMLDTHMRSSEEMELSPTVILGDLNDGTRSVSTELISAQPTYRLFATSRAGSQSDRGLYSVETLQQYRSQRHVFYTYNFKNNLQTLDHIMVSEEFYDHSRKRHWSFEEMEVINDHLNIADESPSQKRQLIQQTGASDHGLVRAEFNWDPIRIDIQRMAAEVG